MLQMQKEINLKSEILIMKGRSYEFDSKDFNFTYWK